MFLPGESQGRGSLMGRRLWGRTESDTAEATQQQQQQQGMWDLSCPCRGSKGLNHGTLNQGTPNHGTLNHGVLKTGPLTMGSSTRDP